MLGKPDRVFDGKSYSLKLKLKDGATFLEVPEFHVQEKGADGKYHTVQKVTDVSGDLHNVVVKTGEYEGQPIRTFTLWLTDVPNKERYFVDVGLGSSLGRTLANSVLNLKAFENVQVGLYSQKSQKDDGKTYPAVSLRQGNAKDTVKWRFRPEDGQLPPAREFAGKGGKIEKDWTATEEFLYGELEKFGAALNKRAPAAQPAEPAAAAPKEEKPAATNIDEDVPF